MNMKSNKGLSMIAVIIVIAAIIFATIETFIIVKKWTKKKELEDLTTVMLLIQARSKNYSDKETIKHVEEDKEEEFKGTIIADVNDNTELNNIIEKGVIEKDEKYYLLTNQDLEELHVYDIKDNEIFLVNYETEEVIYLNGIEKNGEVLYKLSDIKENIESEQEIEETNENSENDEEDNKEEEEKTEETKEEEKQEEEKQTVQSVEEVGSEEL